jgi:hypothetical protein
MDFRRTVCGHQVVDERPRDNCIPFNTIRLIGG